MQQLKLFRARLLNINTRNRSLCLRKEAQHHSFDLAKLGKDAVNKIYRRLCGGGAGIRLAAESDDAGGYAPHLRKLARAAAARAEETGLQELYLGLCWLTGHIAPDTYLRGPLFIVPAQLEKLTRARNAGWHLQLSQNELSVNEAITAAVRKHMGIRPAETLEEDARQVLERAKQNAAFGKTPGRVLMDAWARAAAKAGIKARTMAYETPPLLEKINNKILEHQGKVELSLRGYLAVGMFPQSSTALYANMETLEARAHTGETDQGIVDNLLEASADPENEGAVSDTPLDEINEGKIYSVLPADPSQFEILEKAQRAECLVVRGPPGTGKSQTIVNLVADALAREKRILVVCQKRAALDVVYQRLDEAGIGASASVVHDAITDCPPLYKKLAALLNKRNKPVIPGGATEAQLGAQMESLKANIRAIVEPLHHEFHGVPLHQLYKQARHDFKSVLELPAEFAALGKEELEETLAAMDNLRTDFLRFENARHPLFQRKRLHTVSMTQRQRAEAAFDNLCKIAGEGRGVRLAGNSHSSRAEDSIALFLRLQKRWYRRLNFGWWFAKKQMETIAPKFHGEEAEYWPELLQRGRRVEQTLANLEDVMQAPWIARAFELAAAQPAQLAEIGRETLESFRKHFSEIQQYDSGRNNLPVMASAVMKLCAQALPEGEAWMPRLWQELYFQWIDEAETAHPVLRGKPFEEYARLQRELARKMQQRTEKVRQYLAYKIETRARTPKLDPGKEHHPNTKAGTSWRKLADEFSKKRRIKPIRALLSQYPWEMRRVVPCWLTSPEVASEIFPLERGFFDVAIFDEASQLQLERALPILYRAKRVVISGDEKQMPPSHFFMTSMEDDEDDSDATEAAAGEARYADSLLAQAKRIYGFNYLSWHYRSKYQELIDFSNHEFYDGNLQIVPNMERSGAHTPMRWLPVEGVWSNNTNAVEVQKTADEFAHMLQNKGSIGVITFNQRQQEAILNEIERRAQQDPEFAELYNRANNPASGNLDDKPFVKNIENVQGDERDHIIFSVGYGPDPDGNFYKRFGPLSQEGGENRLNVAITRARGSVTVICSFDPDTLAVDASKNRGPAVFKRYLQYVRAISNGENELARQIAKEGSAPSAVSAAPRQLDFDSPFEEQVFEALKRRGYELETQWGVSDYRIDLAVVDPKEPSRFCLGIECDGATYHSGKSVRERDIARQKFLESRGWRIHRIWSRDYWQNPQREIEKVVEAIERKPRAKARA